MKPDFSNIEISYPESKNKYPDGYFAEVPGLAPYTRGIYPSMYIQHPMETWYEFEETDPKEINRSIKKLVQTGNANFQFHDPFSVNDWKVIFDSVDLQKIKTGFGSDDVLHSFKDYTKAVNIDQSTIFTRVIAEVNEISGLNENHTGKTVRLKPSSYLLFIAKMRSARNAWSQIMNDKTAKLSLDVLITNSENDLVRSTTAAITAWMGGAQSITIQLSSNWENEAFVNIPRVIEEETHIQHAIDALGGSFELEKITRDHILGTIK